MGEARRRLEMGQGARALRPGEQMQVQVDLKNSVPKLCECGCKHFIGAVSVYTISALMSPTGQELIVQQPVLICLECKTVLKIGTV